MFGDKNVSNNKIFGYNAFRIPIIVLIDETVSIDQSAQGNPTSVQIATLLRDTKIEIHEDPIMRYVL